MNTKLLLGLVLLVCTGVRAQVTPSLFAPAGFPNLTNTTPVLSNTNRNPVLGLPSRFGTGAAVTAVPAIVDVQPATLPVPVVPPAPAALPPPAQPVASPGIPGFPKFPSNPGALSPPTVVSAPSAPRTVPATPPAFPAFPGTSPATSAAAPPVPAPIAPPAFPAFPGSTPAAASPGGSLPAPVAPPALPTFQPLQTVTPGGSGLPVPGRGLPAGRTNPIVIAPAVPAVPTVAQPTVGGGVTGSGEKVDTSTLKFQEVPLAEVLETYADFTGKTVLRAPNLALTTPITIKVQGELTMKEAVEALDTVLALNGVTIVPMGTKFVKAVPFAQAQQEAAAFSSTMKLEDMPDAARYMTRILQLKNAKPSEVVPAIQSFAKLPNSILPVDSTQILILRDYSENIKRMLEVIEKIDVAIPIDEDFEVIPIKYALSSDMAAVLGSLTGGGGGGATGRTTGSTRRPTLPTGVGSTVGGTGTLGGQQGMGGQPGQAGFNPQAGNTTPGTQVNTLQQRLQQIVTRAATGTPGGAQPYLGEARIMPYERGNSLLVLANKADMAKVKEVIAKLDVVQQQVLIEAIILDVNLSDDFNLGVTAGQRPVNKGSLVGAGVANNENNILATGSQLLSRLGFGTNAGGVFPNSGGLSYFGRLGPVFDVAVTALAKDSRVNILSRPRIQATHAEQATLFIGETVPYVTGTFFGGINANASSQYQQLAVGISLNVLPLINPDGLVILEIAQNIEQIGGSVRIDNNDVPKTTRRQAQTKVAVNNGDTIVLGGFISSTKDRVKSGIPVLKDIPLLGALFRSQSDKNTRSELMVLIRPTVLATPAVAAQFTSAERNSLPGVRQAEYEFMRDEMLRREKLEAFKKGKKDFESPLIPAGPSALLPRGQR